MSIATIRHVSHLKQFVEGPKGRDNAYDLASIADSIAQAKGVSFPSTLPQQIDFIAESLPTSFQGPYRYASLRLALSAVVPLLPKIRHRLSILSQLEKGTIASWDLLANFGSRWGLVFWADWNSYDGSRVTATRNKLVQSIIDALPDSFTGPYTFNGLTSYMTKKYGSPRHAYHLSRYRD
jgi:hypothetical protein